MPIRVGFVAAGAVSKPEQYVELAKRYQRLLDRCTNSAGRDDEAGSPAFETKIFTEITPALDWLATDTGAGRTLVLLSEALGAQAGQIATAYPEIYVLVFSGAPRQPGKPYYVRKDWTFGEIITTIVRP